MTANEIPFLRLANQCISSPLTGNVKDLVKYLGAVQAQDYRMAKYGIGLRAKNADEQLVDEAIINGDIIRTHVLRPTWHFVSSDDLPWMLDLTASRIRKGMNGRHRDLELTPGVLTKSKKIIRNALSGGNHLTRDELIKLLNDAKIRTDMNRASHIFAEAELSGLICSGAPEGNKQTYALLSERINGAVKINREESLAKLARIYFTSRGPATIRDFSWWSGLNLTDSRTAAGLVNSEFTSFSAGDNTYLYHKTRANIQPDNKLYLLPAFDEYLIGYADRAAVLSKTNADSYVTLNGMFFPIIVHKGQVTGTWKRTIKNNFVDVEFDFFGRVTKRIRELAEAEAEKLADFLMKKLRLNVK